MTLYPLPFIMASLYHQAVLWLVLMNMMYTTKR